MNEKWNVKDEDGNTLKIFTDIHLVADYEKELRDKGIKYSTRMYLDNKPVSKFGESVTGNMVHYKSI